MKKPLSFDSAHHRHCSLLLMMAAVVLFALPIAQASAANVTKIVYAQQNIEYYKFTAPTSGYLWVQIGWTSPYGSAGYPSAEVDGTISGPDGTGRLYADFDIAELYSGTNPHSGSIAVRTGMTYYIGVVPWVADCTYTIDARLGTRYDGQGGTEISCTRMSDGATVTMPQTGIAYGGGGEVFVPSPGDWISQFQTWPGNAGEFYANWDDYVIERSSDMVDSLAQEYQYQQYPPAPTTRTTVVPSGVGYPYAHAQKWYVVAPQLWTGYSVPNEGSYGDFEPGALTYDKAPAWYTYSYPDSSVPTPAPAYFWSPLTDPQASMRTYSATYLKGAALSAKFSGDTLTWLYAKAPDYGKARVSIDGVDKGLVDQYSPTKALQQSTVFSGLGSGDHTITVTNAGERDEASSDFGVSHDVFLARGDPGDPTPVMENSNDGQTSYQWATKADAAASGGSISVEAAKDAACAFEFKGTGISFVYAKGPSFGIARVYIDGVDMGPVNQYSSSWQYQAQTTYAGLAPTTHIILIVNSGTANPGSTGTEVNLDAFTVTGSGAGTYENVPAPRPTAPIVTGGDDAWHYEDVVLTVSGATHPDPGVVLHYECSTNNGATWTTIGDASGATYIVSALAGGTNDGVHTLLFRAVDAAGNAGPSARQDVRIDTTPPQVSVGSPAQQATYLLGQIVNADWTARDARSGLASATGTAEPGAAIDTATFGLHTFTVTASDKAGNSTSLSVTYSVPFSSPGIQQPVDPNGQSIFKQGTTVPLKFSLFDSNGALISTATPRLASVTRLTSSVLGTEVEAVYKDSPSSGDLFRWDKRKSQYIFNLDTKPYPVGTYEVTIDVGGGGLIVCQFSLR